MQYSIIAWFEKYILRKIKYFAYICQVVKIIAYIFRYVLSNLWNLKALQFVPLRRILTLQDKYNRDTGDFFF